MKITDPRALHRAPRLSDYRPDPDPRLRVVLRPVRKPVPRKPAQTAAAAWHRRHTAGPMPGCPLCPEPGYRTTSMYGRVDRL